MFVDTSVNLLIDMYNFVSLAHDSGGHWMPAVQKINSDFCKPCSNLSTRRTQAFIIRWILQPMRNCVGYRINLFKPKFSVTWQQYSPLTVGVHSNIMHVHLKKTSFCVYGLVSSESGTALEQGDEPSSRMKIVALRRIHLPSSLAKSASTRRPDGLGGVLTSIYEPNQGTLPNVPIEIYLQGT